MIQGRGHGGQIFGVSDVMAMEMAVARLRRLRQENKTPEKAEAVAEVLAVDSAFLESN